MLNHYHLRFRNLNENDIPEIVKTFNLNIALKDNIIIRGAFYQGSLIGLICVAEYSNHFELLGFIILPLFRGRGIGSSLFDLVISEISDTNFGKPITADYNSNQCDISRINNFLIKKKWKYRLQYFEIEVKIKNLPNFMTQNDMSKIKRIIYSHNIDIHSMESLSDVSRKEIAAECASADEYLSPFYDEDHSNPVMSFCYKKNDILCGWIVANRVINKSLNVKSIYIKKEFRDYKLFRLILSHFHNSVITDMPELQHYSFSYDSNDFKLSNLYRRIFVESWSSKTEHFKAIKK